MKGFTTRCSSGKDLGDVVHFPTPPLRNRCFSAVPRLFIQRPIPVWTPVHPSLLPRVSLRDLGIPLHGFLTWTLLRCRTAQTIWNVVTSGTPRFPPGSLTKLVLSLLRPFVSVMRRQDSRSVCPHILHSVSVAVKCHKSVLNWEKHENAMVCGPPIFPLCLVILPQAEPVRVSIQAFSRLDVCPGIPDGIPDGLCALDYISVRCPQRLVSR